MALLLFAAILAAAACVLWFLPRNSQRLWKLTIRISAGILMCASALTLLGFLFRGAMCGRYEFPPILSCRVTEDDINQPRVMSDCKYGHRVLIRYPNDSRYAEEFRCQPEWEGIHIECVGYAPDYTKPVGQMPPVRRWLW